MPQGRVGDQDDTLPMGSAVTLPIRKEASLRDGLIELPLEVGPLPRKGLVLGVDLHGES